MYAHWYFYACCARIVFLKADWRINASLQTRQNAVFFSLYLSLSLRAIENGAAIHAFCIIASPRHCEE
jgi:hypothetical protein